MKNRLRKTQLAAALCLSIFGAIFSPSVMAEDTLGRLFFTPERRQELDRQRQFNIQEEQETPEDPTLTINGVVTRSSGKKTVWVNGRAMGDNDPGAGVDITPVRTNPGRVVIRAPESAPALGKVGNTVNLDSGETKDLLRGGSLIIHPSHPKR